jgi:hypothetical protein
MPKFRAVAHHTKQNVKLLVREEARAQFVFKCLSELGSEQLSIQDVYSFKFDFAVKFSQSCSVAQQMLA